MSKNNIGHSSLVGVKVLFIVCFSIIDLYAGENQVAYKNIYTNSEYLYSFSVPGGLRCLTDPPPSPNHGCGIYLSKIQKAYLWVNANYNVSDSLSPADEYLRKLDPLIEEGVDIKVIKREKIHLSDSGGERFVIRYRKRENKKEDIVEDIVVSIKTIEKYGDIVYTIGLTTPESRYKSDRKIFERVLASFAFNLR